MAMEKEKKPRIDWEVIERDYRAGVLSIRGIAESHNISDKAVRNKAKAKGWQRDLSSKVNEKVRTDLVRSESAPEDNKTEREIVEVAAATVVQVVRGHRAKIRQGNELVELLTKQLMDVAGRREEFELQIESECEEDRSSERKNRLMKAVSLSTHSTIAVNLANAAKTWIGLERQAFNIKDETEPPENGIAQLLAAVNGSSLPIK